MLKNLLKEAVENVIGKQSEQLTDLLDSKNHVNEFLIAKKMDLTINQTRNLLYKLSDFNLVSSIRKKDKRKGWYTYFWKIEVLKTLGFLKADYKKKVEQTQTQIKSRSSKQFYHCERCNIEISEENALPYNFTCAECGEIFTLKDNAKVINEMNKRLNLLNKKIEEIEKEEQEQRKLVEKKIIKENKKEQKAKKERRRKTNKKEITKEKTSTKKVKKITKKRHSVKKVKKSVSKKIISKKIKKKKIKKPVHSSKKKTKRR
jgi:transcription factor E